MIYFLASIAAIAGFLFGYDEGVIAVARPLLDKDFPMTAFVGGFMTAAVPLGALAGASVAGRLTDRFGRQRVLMAAATLFAIGALIAAGITTIWLLVAARFVLGLAIGVAAVTAPLYIAEAAPLAIRGALVSTYQLAITFGILVSYLSGLAITGDGMWRIMFALGAVPGVLFLVGLTFLPESPRWLVLKGFPDRARNSLLRLRGTGPQVDGELDEIARTVKAEGGQKTSYSVLWEPTIRPALIVGVGLFFLQQLSGINAVIYYAPEIFNHAGFDSSHTQILATVGVGTVNFLTTILAMYLIDKMGRRPLLILGFAGTAATMLAIAFAVINPAVPAWVVIVALLLYIASFAISIGPLPHVMMSEIFPLRVRGPGMSMASISNWGFNFIVVFAFPLMLNWIGLALTFTIFAIVCLGGILFTTARVPETTGHSLEAIEAHLKSGRPFVALGAARS
jgi:sugar porter (SP) family MFS transporter